MWRSGTGGDSRLHLAFQGIEGVGAIGRRGDKRRPIRVRKQETRRQRERRPFCFLRCCRGNGWGAGRKEAREGVIQVRESYFVFCTNLLMDDDLVDVIVPPLLGDAGC